MVLENICGPVILYLGFSLIQIIIDIFKNLYNTAFLKFMIMIIFSVILNLLCSMNLSIISWFLVFIPFIFMTFISSVLLFVFGLNPGQGSANNYIPGQSPNPSPTPSPTPSSNAIHSPSQLSSLIIPIINDPVITKNNDITNIPITKPDTAYPLNPVNNITYNNELCRFNCVSNNCIDNKILNMSSCLLNCKNNCTIRDQVPYDPFFKVG